MEPFLVGKSLSDSTFQVPCQSYEIRGVVDHESLSGYRCKGLCHLRSGPSLVIDVYTKKMHVCPPNLETKCTEIVYFDDCTTNHPTCHQLGVGGNYPL